jgi:hypothetical protein
MAFHKHRKGWRGSFTLTTPVYNTKAEAEADLADLRASVQLWPGTRTRPARSNRHPWASTPGPVPPLV